MIRSSLLVALALPFQTATAPAGDDATAETSASPVEVGEAVDVDYGARMSEIVAATGAREWSTAVAGADALLEEGHALTEYERAEVHYARGLALTFGAPDGLADAGAAGAIDPKANDWLEGASAFASARALAGPGVLRRHATYDRGVAHLLLGDAWRAQIPEIAAQAGGPPPGAMAPPSAPGGSGPAGADPPDPIEQARVAYGAAKEHLIERLRADWRDVDTRANLELIQRRLAELDEIERQREEQQSDQQDSQDPGEEGDPGDEGEDDEEREPNEDGEQGEQDPSEEQPEGEESESSDEEGGDEPEDESEPEQQEVAPEEVPRPEEGEGEAQSGEVSDERHLTREEVMRLLDRLAELEKEGEALRALIEQASRIPVDRDW